MRKGQRLWTLFSSMLYISAFTFGGGFVIVSLMQKKFVDQLHWLEEEEMLDMTALAQASPGAIAVNAAILVGRKVAGGAGMAVAVLGTILPPMVVLSVISLAYQAFASNPWAVSYTHLDVYKRQPDRPLPPDRERTPPAIPAGPGW